MNSFKIIGFWGAIGLFLLTSFPVQSDTLTGVTNPCPAGYEFFFDGEHTYKWDLCIADEVKDNATIMEFWKTCSMANSDNELRAWNPDAGVCFFENFDLAVGPEVLNDKIFTVTRDATTANNIINGQVRIDLYENLNDAGCEGPAGGYLMSPGNVYCLKDDGGIIYSLEDIENDAEEYYTQIHECLGDENADEVQLRINAYNRYLDFAYLENPNIILELGFTVDIDEHNNHEDKNQNEFSYEKDSSDTTDNREDFPIKGGRGEDPCTIVARSVVGITN